MAKLRITTTTSPHEYGDGGIRVVTNHGTKKYQFTFFENGKKIRRFFNYDNNGLKAVKNFQSQIKQDKADDIKGTSKSLFTMIDEYLMHYKKKRLEEASLQRNINTLFALCGANKDFMNQRFDTITATDIQIALNNLADKKSASEARKAYILLNETFRTAVNNDIIRKNPCDGLDCPTYKSPEKTIFSTEEIIRTFSAIRFMKRNYSASRDYFTLYLFLFCTGTRINEALASKWSDINWGDKPTIHIQRTIDSHHRGGQITKEPKTKAGNRFVPLPPRLIKRLKKIRPETDKGYIFPTASGKALSVHNFHRTWEAVFRATARECPVCRTKRPTSWDCSCGHHITHKSTKCPVCKQNRPILWKCPNCNTVITEIQHTPHEIRHTYASYLANNRIPDTTIAYLLGHTSTNVLWNTYAHKPTNYYDQVSNLFNSKLIPKKS